MVSFYNSMNSKTFSIFYVVKTIQILYVLKHPKLNQQMVIVSFTIRAAFH